MGERNRSYGELTMKRMVLVTILLLGGALNAQADTSTYNNICKEQRGDYELQIDAQYCDQRLGPVMNGANTSARYKKCMLSRGWRYERTNREHTWIDPETGLTCRDILGGL